MASKRTLFCLRFNSRIYIEKIYVSKFQKDPHDLYANKNHDQNYIIIISTTKLQILLRNATDINILILLKIQIPCS